MDIVHLQGTRLRSSERGLLMFKSEIDPDVLNWQESLRMANNNERLAKELLKMLVEELPAFQAEINHSYQQQNFQELLAVIHKLHGGCCYCGVTTLRKITAEFELVVKADQQSQYHDYLDRLNLAIVAVLEAFKLLEKSAS